MGMGGGDWRTGSVYSQPFAPPPMAFGPNPFDSPAMGSDMASLRPPTVFTQGGMMGPGYGMRGSTYSLATTANPFQSGPAPNTDPSPTDETVLSTLRTYLNSQDLMTV
jgi:chitin synthase